MTAAVCCALLMTATSAFAQEEDEPLTDAPHLELGGALRFNLLYAGWKEDTLDRAVDFVFDTFRLNADGRWLNLRLSAEYRLYAGFHMLHHGSVGYVFSERLRVDLGVTRVPFGLLPYASHNWFFDLPYYVGLEDDSDLGVKAVYEAESLQLQLAFYLNDEGHYTGRSRDSARYSYDVVQVGAGVLPGVDPSRPILLEEVNQVNARLEWTLESGEALEVALGASGQLGGLYDAATGDHGHHWAVAAHLELSWRRLNVQLEGYRYAHEPPGMLEHEPFVPMGAYDAPYKVARRASGLVANVAWQLPVKLGPLELITVYDDFSWLAKDRSDFPDSFQNVLGASFLAGPLLVYMDIAAGRHHPFLGPDYASALAEGTAGASWEVRLNANIGWYF